MSYIGRGTESISNVEVLDNLTFNGSASYTLQKSSTNFVPSSANNLLISISGVVQQGNFSVSGSTITFDTTVSASDTCDWILHYGTGLITTVADGAITEAKLGSNAVTTAKINNSAITTAKINDDAVTYAKTDGNFGKIGQVVYGSTTSNVESNSNSYVDTGITATITPSATSSTIHIFINIMGLQSAGTTNARMDFNLLRGSTSITTSGANKWSQSANDTHRNGGFAMNFKDSPSSTSALTYKVQFKAVEGTCNVQRDGNSGASTITLMEVLA